MKIIVVGGGGLIGSKLVNNLREHGHEAVIVSINATSPLVVLGGWSSL
jgi:uncharacterized protein YbjT (DUF2867 family)